VLYLDGIGDRVITKLNVSLPDCRTMPPKRVALRMVDAIFDYVESPPGRLRWQRRAKHGHRFSLRAPEAPLTSAPETV
jgi:hypothetical protein